MYSPTPKRLRLFFSHDLRVPIEALCADLGNTGGTVAAKYQGEEFGKCVVELATLHGVCITTALRTAILPGLLIAGTHRAPRGLFVALTSGAFACQVLAAGSTIEATGRYQRGIDDHIYTTQ